MVLLLLCSPAAMLLLVLALDRVERQVLAEPQSRERVPLPAPRG
jgi:hypothetical protein